MEKIIKFKSVKAKNVRNEMMNESDVIISKIMRSFL